MYDTTIPQLEAIKNCGKEPTSKTVEITYEKWKPEVPVSTATVYVLQSQGFSFEYVSP